MNVNEMLKSIVKVGVVYGLLNLSFQAGKGYAFRVMKKHDVTVDEMIDIVKECDDLPMHDKIKCKIISFVAEYPK